MKKYPALIIAVVILAGGAYYTQQYFIESSVSNSAVVATTTDAHSAPTEQAAVVIIPSTADAPKTPTTSSAIPTPNVTFSVPDASYSLYATPGATVLDIMRLLASTTGFTFTGRDYPSLGFFVESINGTSPENGYVWIFYVNGLKSGKGVSSSALTSGDAVEWKYEKSY